MLYDCLPRRMKLAAQDSSTSRIRLLGISSIAAASCVKNGKPAQRVSFGVRYPADVQADIPADVRGQKLRSGPQNPGKTSISVRTSMTRRRGRPWPQGGFKKLRSEKHRAEFSFPIVTADMWCQIVMACGACACVCVCVCVSRQVQEDPPPRVWETSRQCSELPSGERHSQIRIKHIDCFCNTMTFTSVSFEKVLLFWRMYHSNF